MLRNTGNHEKLLKIKRSHQEYWKSSRNKEINRPNFPLIQIEKAKYILRVTDKTGIFHLGRATDYEQKAEAYRQKTGAHIELTTNPLWTVFDKVVHLLNDLCSKKPH